MSLCYCGRIAIIDMTTALVTYEKPEARDYRSWLGGPGFAAMTLLKLNPKGVDAFSPENRLIFAAGLLNGITGPGVPRYTVMTRSPLTGTIANSQAGGFFGPALKKAGYDGLVISGCAKEPSYLLVTPEGVTLKPAGGLWGLTTSEARQALRTRHGSDVICAIIGLAGENLVRYACISNELAHFNGRGGTGAVMGSKLLKAIVVKGGMQLPVSDDETIKNIARKIAKGIKDHPLALGLHTAGTPAGVSAVNAGGCLPTENWHKGTFAAAPDIGTEGLEVIEKVPKSCFACPIRCKRVVEMEGYIDPAYGGPEYETLVAFGSNLGVGDVRLIAKVNELCNAYTIDTISFGMTLSFAFSCYERGLITKEQTGGLELRFGEKAREILIELTNMTAHRIGFGKELAEGSKRMAERLGSEAKAELITVKGQEAPMHDPRTKGAMGLQYALSPFGADHWTAQHDQLVTAEGSKGLLSLAPLGILEPMPPGDLSWRKIRFYYYTNMLTNGYDCMGACAFAFGARSITPVEDLVEMAAASTGWNLSLWEIMKAGERAVNLMRLYNLREGFTSADDTLPERFFNNFEDGPLKGTLALDRKTFEEAIVNTYRMLGWDENGRPLPAKLYELGLDEFVPLLDSFIMK